MGPIKSPLGALTPFGDDKGTWWAEGPGKRSSHWDIVEARVNDWNRIFNINYWDFRKSLRKISLYEIQGSNQFEEILLCHNRGSAVARKEWWDNQVGKICYPRDDDDVTHINASMMELLLKRFQTEALDIMRCGHQELRYANSLGKVIINDWGDEKFKERMPTSSYFFYVDRKDVHPRLTVPLFQGGAAKVYNSEKSRAGDMEGYVSLGFHSPASITTLKNLDSEEDLEHAVEAWKNIETPVFKEMRPSFRRGFYERLDLIEKLKLK
jgi:hypothetical protein